jgi:C_GCAxxG_C_C family probable redox protein
MWERDQLGAGDLLWAATNFIGGIAGNRDAVCGAVSGASIYLGLRNRTPPEDKEKASKAREKSRLEAHRLVAGFRAEHGTIICGELLGIDFTDEAAAKRFRESGEQRRKCDSYVRSVITALFGMDGS